MTIESQSKTGLYASALYAEMRRTARDMEIEGSPVKLWRGAIVETCNSLGIPQGTYRRVTKRLEELGCIEFVQRGARGYPSVVILNYPPTEEVWQASERRALTNRPTAARLVGRVKDLEAQLGGINLGQAFNNIEVRLKELESWKEQAEGSKSSKGK